MVFDGEAKHPSMYLFEERLSTFQSWPFGDDCACAADKMAEAGFYVVDPKNEPDLVKCFFCYKELNGWEEDDNPWREHESHSPQCCFVKLGKRRNEITIGDLIRLHMDRTIHIMKKQYDLTRQQFSEAYETAKDTLTYC